MKKRIITCLIVIVLLVASFFAGSYSKKQKYYEERVLRCRTLVSFALDKVENEDFTDQSVIKALASNIYAAYQYCDDSKTADQLHDLWNYILDYSDDSGAKDVVVQELRSVINSYKSPKK